MEQLPWVKIFAASLEMLMILPADKAGRVIQAAGRYFKFGELPQDLDQTETIVFDRLKVNVDESADAYIATCERNRRNSEKQKGSKSQVDNQKKPTGVPVAPQWEPNGGQVGNQMNPTGEPNEPKAEAEAEAEAEALIESTLTPPSEVPLRANEAEFTQFWLAYPRRVGKKDARKAFDKAIKTTDIATIIDAVNRQKHSLQWKKNGGQFIPHPSTWLNQGRWEDEMEVVTNGYGNDGGKDLSFRDLQIGTVL